MGQNIKHQRMGKGANPVCWTVFLLITGVFSDSTFEEIDAGIREKRQTPFKLCGNQLVGMLNLVCSLRLDAAQLHANFEDYLLNVLSRRKRSIDENFLQANRWVGKRSGLAIHCCTKSCTLQELRDFC